MYCSIKVVIVCLYTMLFFCNCNSNKKDPTPVNKVEENTETPPKSTKKVILFFGDSITAGYGLEEDQAYPVLIQNKIDALNLNYKCVNAGLSGETSSGGLSRIDWILKQEVSIFVLELGANDGLRGISPQETEKNLKAIIDKVTTTSKETKIILAGMKVPPNMGENFATQFETIFPRIAAEKKVILIPFLLEGVAGNPNLNQADRIHPTPEGAQIIANSVWNYLEPLLE